MILYHGSNLIVETPKIMKSEHGRDFGFGFYTTDIKEQAIRWAIRKAKLMRRKGQPYTPYVSVFEFDEENDQKLNCIHFDEPSME